MTVYRINLKCNNCGRQAPGVSGETSHLGPEHKRHGDWCNSTGDGCRGMLLNDPPLGLADDDPAEAVEAPELAPNPVRKMTDQQAETFRGYFRAALTGVAMAAATRPQGGVEEPDVQPSGLANEALFLASAAMDLDAKMIEPSTEGSDAYVDAHGGVAPSTPGYP